MPFKPRGKVNIFWSSRFAYAIGLLASDGNLTRDRRHISLGSIDKEIVENLKIGLGIKTSIFIANHGPRRKRFFVVSFSDIIFYRFLNNIGLTSAKSKTIGKVEIPDEYIADFLRGFFDGDGSFYSFWNKRWPNSFGFKMTLASASKEFLDWMLFKLSELYSVKGHIRRGKGVYEARYVKNDTRILFQKMYHSDQILFLERKFEKMRICFELDEMIKEEYHRNHRTKRLPMPR